MTTHTAVLPYALADEVQSFGALSIVPLFPEREPAFDYVGLDEAAARGLAVTELDEAGDVETLLLHNPLADLVLLYAGEELAGAKQNRILRRSILAAPGSKMPIPVVCVERGRWAYRRRDFAPAPRAAYPELRRSRTQAEVWANVAAKQERMDAFSPTGAAEELYVSNALSLEEHLAAFPRLEGQSGAAVAIGGRVACLDFVGRSDVWAGLHAKLVRGYALDALEARAGGEFPARDLSRLLKAWFRARRVRRPDVGLGVESALDGPAAGSELVHEGEVVALTLFPAA